MRGGRGKKGIKKGLKGGKGKERNRKWGGVRRERKNPGKERNNSGEKEIIQVRNEKSK